MKIEELAKICHQANKAYCESLNDFSQVNWELTFPKIRESAINGVNKIVKDPNTTPEEMHDNWCDFKKNEGYKYGKIKDDTLKTHPCLVSYDKLDKKQTVKDELFRTICLTFLPFLTQVAVVEKAKEKSPDEIALDMDKPRKTLKLHTKKPKNVDD